MKGITANQMVSAPKGSVYIWCNDNLVYPKALARKLGRTDLEIHRPCFLREKFRGRRFSGLILDHAVELSNSEFLNYLEIKKKIEINNTKSTEEKNSMNFIDKAKSWPKITITEPTPGTECFFFGIARGDYGYTEDKEKVMRGIAKEPVKEKGRLYPSCQILEVTPRYWNGFTPLRYKKLSDLF